MKIKILIYEYKLRQSSKARKYSNKNLEAFFNSKLHFHNHVNCKFSHCIYSVVGSSSHLLFPGMHVHIILYPITSKPEYASVVWNKATDDNKLERMQLKFTAFYFNCSFPQIPLQICIRFMSLTTAHLT
jgi:hypothetical protein